MSDDARIGRVLVASLHQAIADVLPDRLEFYENWLKVPGLREGTIGLAPLSAVLSFLRLEGEAYNRTTARAGEYAADWTVSSMSALERRLIGALPTTLRHARRFRTARALVRSTYPGSRVKVRLQARHGVDRSARLALLRDARGDRDAAVRVLRGRDRPRAPAFLARRPTRRCTSAARPSRGKGCRLKVEVRGASAGEPAAAA